MYRFVCSSSVCYILPPTFPRPKSSRGNLPCSLEMRCCLFFFLNFTWGSLGRLTFSFHPSRAIAQLRACRPIPEAQVRELCHKARELLIEEGNIVTVAAPVTVCLNPENFLGEIRGDPIMGYHGIQILTESDYVCRYAATFTGSFMISWSSSELAAIHRIRIISSWV